MCDQIKGMEYKGNSRQMGTEHLGINTGFRSLWVAFSRKKRLDEHTFMLDSQESRKSLFLANGNSKIVV